MHLESDIIDQIYDIPLGRSSWNDVLILLVNKFNAELGILFMAPDGGPHKVITSTSPDESFWGEYNSYYCRIDPWNEILAAGEAQTNRIAAGSSFLSNKEFFKTEYFNDWWKYYNLYYTAGGLLETDNKIMVQLGLPRTDRAGDYTTDEINELNVYVSHIKRALELEGVLGKSLPHEIYQNALVSRFGLTQAEANLALNLFKTHSLKKSAAELHRSYHTVRTQLKSIFGKTETSSQLTLLMRLSDK